MLVQHELVSADLTLACTNPGFWTLIGEVPPTGRISVFEVMPELFGLEEEIALILAEGTGEVTLPCVTRAASEYGAEGTYLDIALIADAAVAPCLLLIATDVTNQSVQQRGLMQSRNENALLQEKLTQMNERIREHSHSLELAVSQRTRELRETRLEIIRRLALAAESRDPLARGHLSRMSRYSAMIAEQIGVEESERQIIYHASLLHDVGKIAIPDRILQKPGPLSTEELTEMRRHTIYGADILGGSTWEFMRAAVTIALTHHERWDGQGYPNGLKGLEIPLFGRICAVADVFDALTMKRPYKAAWSVDEAAAFVAKQSGSAFQPLMAEAFADILPDVRRAQAQDGSEESSLEELSEG